MSRMTRAQEAELRKIPEEIDIGVVEQSKRRRRARARKLIRDIIKFGRDDSMKGSWDPWDREFFDILAPQRRASFLKRLLEL